uniref:Uncharacterized protein n=1 Tax=Oryza glumipatula TaxID=40148 RepID=A0A0E0AV04_9ORYZ
MEKAAITAFVHNVLGPVVNMLGNRLCMVMSVSQDSASMGHDIIMLASAIDDQLVPGACGEELRELTRDMEDCIERFLHRVACAEDQGAPRARRVARCLRTAHIRYRFATQMKALKKRLSETRERWLTHAILSQSSRRPDDHTTPTPTCLPAQVQPEHVELNPVGIEPAQRELLTMLEEEPAELRVAAIVGFGGSGKTTLAKAVFRSIDVTSRFGSSRAWVDRAKDKNTGEILKSLLQQFGFHQILSVYDERKLQAQLKNFLRGRRYLIVLDDIGNEQWWENIKSIFEESDTNTSSRIIVTTALRSQANYLCSDGKGFIYQMQSLEDQDCKRIALGMAPPLELQMGSEELLKKCDGHPLSLVCVANYFRSKAGQPTGATGQHCRELCRYLGSHIHEDRYFERLKGLIVDNYTSLSNHSISTCLMYLGIFPADVPLERKVIIRRWLAEGYAIASSGIEGSDKGIAQENFETLVDRNLLHPISNVCKNADVKACKSRGTVHEFMLRKSIVERFIMSFPDWRMKVRHLCIDHRKPRNRRRTTDMNLSCVRSLTVFGTAGDTIFEFNRYKILRVLDLEECNDVNNKHFEHICKLWNLRYLSLGAKITVIPKAVAKLKLLETLCLRKTSVEELPVQVIGLPFLLHLIGKFRISDHGYSKSKLIKISEKSKLETLSGFIAEFNSHEFLEILGHMKNLKKVKIWCCQSSAAGDHDSILARKLSEAIQEYITGPFYIGDHHDRKLSICLQGFSGSFLNSVNAPCDSELRSLKLHADELRSLPHFVKCNLGLHITELCLSSVTVTRDVLSDLGELEQLLYLKLIADRIDEFEIPNGAFPNLLRLCFMVRSPYLPTFEAGALPKLVSLQLLCRDLEGLAGVEIGGLVKLKEVTLHSEVMAYTKQSWEIRAGQHPNRPRILLPRRG